MKTVRTISRYAAFVWLWRKDSDAKWFWLRCWLFTPCNLNICVYENLRDFGLTAKSRY